MKKSVDFRLISAYDTPDRSPGFLLWQISSLWRSSIETILKPLDLTHPQFVILATIGWLTRHGDRITQVKISKMAGLDPNTVSQILRGLEQKGLILREKLFDGRAKNPILTANGADILKKAIPAVETKDAEFFHILTAEEMESMIGIFQKLISMK